MVIPKVIVPIEGKHMYYFELLYLIRSVYEEEINGVLDVGIKRFATISDHVSG